MANPTHIPELFSLCKLIQRPEIYAVEVERALSDAKNENGAISDGECSLFHHLDDWDSRIAGFSVGKVEFVLGSDRNEIGNCIEEFLSLSKYHYIVIRLSQEHIVWIQEFERHGAILLDTTVDMAVLLPQQMRDGSEEGQVITADKANNVQLLECYKSFNLGRFFTDPEVSYGVAAYKEWIENSLSKKAADEVLAFVDVANKVHGLVTLRSGTLGDLKILKVPILVKHPESSLRGISHKLLAGAFSATKNDGYNAALISTQGSNIAAQLGYLSAGFRPYNTGVTLRILATT